MGNKGSTWQLVLYELKQLHYQPAQSNRAALPLSLSLSLYYHSQLLGAVIFRKDFFGSTFDHRGHMLLRIERVRFKVAPKRVRARMNERQLQLLRFLSVALLLALLLDLAPESEREVPLLFFVPLSIFLPLNLNLSLNLNRDRKFSAPKREKFSPVAQVLQGLFQHNSCTE